MGFDYTIEMDEPDLRATFHIDPAKQSPLNSERNSVRAFVMRFQLDISRELMPVCVEFTPKSSVSISPCSFQITDEQELEYSTELVIQGSDTEPINFYTDIFCQEDSAKKSGTFEIYAPSYRIFKWGKQILPTRWDTDYSNPTISAQKRADLVQGRPMSEVANDLKLAFQIDTNKQAATKLIDELSRWLPAWESYYFRILLNSRLDNSSVVSEGSFVNRYWANVLITGDDFDFSNWNEFIQFIDTTRILENSPTLDEEEITREVMSFLVDDEMERTEPLKHLWELEYQYDLSMNALGYLQAEELITFLAITLSKKDYQRAQEYIGSLSTAKAPSDITDDIKRAKEASDKEALRRWRDLLGTDPYEHRSDFLYIAENYLKLVSYMEDNLSLVTREAIAEARMAINKERNEPNYVRTARHNYHYYRGIRYRRKDRYQNAREEMLLAIEMALGEYANYDDIRFTRIDEPIIHYYLIEYQRLQEKREFSKAKRRLEEGFSMVDQFEYFEEHRDEKEYIKKRLQVFIHEVEGNRLLSNRELDLAGPEFGKAVGILNQLDRSEQATYFENRKRSVEAAKNEQRGNFETASNIHQSISDSMSDRNNYAQFHQARAKVCEAKKAMTQRKIESARNKLETIQFGWGITRDEIEYLNLILDELEEYESGGTSDIAETLNAVSGLSLETNDDLYVSYGHNYQPLLVNILAAQRLTQFEIDESIPEILVEFSLDYILRPNQVEKFIQREGLSNLGLEDQWRETIPNFTLRQHQQDVRTEASKIDSGNFMNIADSITGTIEQYLGFIVEYHAHMEYGSDWQEKVHDGDDDPALAPLVMFLNKSLFDDLPWISTVRDILSREKYADVVTQGKEGTLADLRNDFSHKNISHVNKETYEELKNDAEEIFAETAVEMPVLGEVQGQNRYGAYTIKLFQSSANNEVEVMTDMELDTGEVYYFPPETPEITPGDNLSSDTIVPCTSVRIQNAISDYQE